MAILFCGNFILSMEGDEQLHQDLALYKKNIHDMLGAVMEDDASYVEILSYRCSNINKPIFNYCDSRGKFWNKVTPLILAVFYNRQQTFDFLIEKKVRLGVKDEFGDTALHIAARTGRDHLVKKLLDADANIELKNLNGQTPLQVAKDSLLRKYAHIINHVLKISLKCLNWRKRNCKNCIHFKVLFFLRKCCQPKK